MAQLEICVVVGVVAVVAILSIVLAGRKEDQVLTEENVIEEGEESPKVIPPKIETNLTKIRGIGPKRSEKLKAAGINPVKDLVGYGSKELAHEVAVPEKIAFKWIENANEILALESIDR